MAEEPSASVTAEMANPKASAQQNGGGGAMDLNSQVNIGQGLASGTKGFNEAVLKHDGVDGNLVDKIGQSPLTAAAGGQINALQGLQTADVSAKVSGQAITPPSLNQGQLGTQSVGKGQ